MCTIVDRGIEPTRNVARAERVAAALGRWGAFLRDGRVALSFTSSDFEATLASLPPFLKAAPPEPAALDIVMAADLTIESRQPSWLSG